MFIDGEWQIVIIDDFFPTSSNTGNIAFTRPNGNELWVILLEKAWAKINGGYINIIGGFSYEPLHVLSSFSTKFFYIEFENDLFKKVQSNLNENKIMCISTFNIVGAEAVELERKFGIIVGHAYSLLNAKEGFFNNKQIQLLQLRNPWGRGEWKGDWSDTSPQWTEETKKHFGYENTEDGIFWMEAENVKKYYNRLDNCLMKFDTKAKLQDLSGDEIKYPVVFNLYLETDSAVTFSLILPSRRFNRFLPLNWNRHACIIIANYTNDKIEEVSLSDIEWNDSLEVRKELKKGFYVIIGHIICDLFLDPKPNKAAFKVVSESSFRLKYVGYDNEYNIIKKVLFEKLISENKVNKTPDDLAYTKCWISSDNNLPVYGICCLRNDNQGIFKIDIVQKTRNVVLLSPHQENQFSIAILPKSDYILLARIVNRAESSSLLLGVDCEEAEQNEIANIPSFSIKDDLSLFCSKEFANEAITDSYYSFKSVTFSDLQNNRTFSDGGNNNEVQIGNENLKKLLLASAQKPLSNLINIEVEEKRSNDVQIPQVDEKNWQIKINSIKLYIKIFVFKNSKSYFLQNIKQKCQKIIEERKRKKEEEIKKRHFVNMI